MDQAHGQSACRRMVGLGVKERSDCLTRHWSLMPYSFCFGVTEVMPRHCLSVDIVNVLVQEEEEHISRAHCITFIMLSSLGCCL